MPIYMKYDGIDGGNFIELLAFNVSCEHHGNNGGGGGGATGKSVEEIVITKQTDRSSPQFMMACDNGRHSKEATIYQKVQKIDFIVIKLRDVVVSSFNLNASGEDRPTESLSLNFSKVDLMVNDIPTND